MLLESMDYLQMSIQNETVGRDAAATASLHLPIFQALSLLDYVTNSTQSDGDEWKLLLDRRARMYVWAYRMSSRSAYMGATIVVAGIVVVVAQICVRLAYRIESKSSTQMLASAFAHEPQDEFNGVNGDDAQVNRLRFRVQDVSGTPGGLRFRALHL